MNGLAALGSGLMVALLVGWLTGGLPSLTRRRRHPTPSQTSTLLRAAGVTWPAAAVHASSIAGAATVLMIVGSLTGVLTLAAMPAAVAALMPRLVLRRRADGRVRDFRGAWPDAIAQLSGVIRSGRTLNEALVGLAADPPPPLGPLLAGLASRIRAVGTIAALQALRDTAAEPVTDRVVEVLCIAHEAGGRVVPDILDDLGRGIGDEIRVADELQQLSHEGRLNAKLVFTLPWVVLVILTAGDGPYQAFYSSPPGTVVIAIATGLSTIGIWLVGWLSAAEDMPRVTVQAS